MKVKLKVCTNLDMALVIISTVVVPESEDQNLTPEHRPSVATALPQFTFPVFSQLATYQVFQMRRNNSQVVIPVNAVRTEIVVASSLAILKYVVTAIASDIWIVTLSHKVIAFNQPFFLRFSPT